MFLTPSRGCVGVAPIGDAQPEMSCTRIQIIMSVQVFSKDDIDIELGQIYLSKEAITCAMSIFAIRQNFETIVDKSTKSLLIVKCKHDTCGWRIRTRKLRNSTYFKISRYINNHTCSCQLMNHEHQQTRSRVKGNLIKSKFTNVSRTYRAKEIMQDMHE